MNKQDSYILDRVNHETDIIMSSDWFDDLIEKKVRKILKEIKDIEIYPLFNLEEKEIVNNTIAEAICRAGYNLDLFDWDIKGELIDEV